MPVGAKDDFLANWGSQARKGVLELMVMSALAEREFYGYELVEHIKARGGLEIGDGTLYTILSRLKNDALVRSRWEAAEKGPARKYYSLTKDGRATLEAMRRIWADMYRGVERIHAGGRKDA